MKKKAGKRSIKTLIDEDGLSDQSDQEIITKASVLQLLDEPNQKSKGIGVELSLQSKSATSPGENNLIFV